MRFLIFITFVISSYFSYAQYSLYSFTEPRVNPASQASGKHATLSALYRGQQSVPGAQQRSAYLSARYPFLRRKSPWSAIGVEMINNNEGAGGILETTILGIGYARNFPITKYTSFSSGVFANYFWRRINTSRLFTGNQFVDNLGFDTSLDPGENLTRFNSRHLSVSWGIRWQRVDKRANPKSHFGIALYNINRPSEQFISANEKLPLRLIADGAHRVYESRKFSVTAELLLRLENQRLFWVPGGRADVNLQAYNNALRGQSLSFKLRYFHFRGIMTGIVWNTERFSIGAGYDIPAWGSPANQGAFEIGMQLRKEVRPKLKRKKKKRRKRKKKKQQTRRVPFRKPGVDDDKLTILGDPEEPDEETKQDDPVIPMDSVIHTDTVEIVTIHFEFEFGSAIAKVDQDLLNHVVERLRENDELLIEIVGHTDNVGAKSYNQKLSVERALSVYQILIKEGIDEDRMKYYGKGETLPLVENDTEENMARNRRVEIIFISTR